MTVGFADHFSRDSSAYARFRPGYPPELFSWLATLLDTRQLAWDCATGNGQAVTMLARHFRRVVGSDASGAQLRAAPRTPGVDYLAALGESSALAPGRVNLVTVAQAFHWLDKHRFYAEVDRVLADGGVLAVWCYGVLHATPGIEQALERFYNGAIGPYWPAERVHVETGYRDYDIPIAEVPAPPLAIEASLTLDQLLGYLRTWSAVGKFSQANGSDPVDEFALELAPLWGDPDSAQPIVWPISMRAGRWLGSGGTRR
jgi:SAM-dependent methyltransferase